jgi:spore germination cell wall hydrolase CwlJ-like protein
MMAILRIIAVSVFLGGISFSAQAGSNPGPDERLTRDVHCLAQNIYHEARGEPMAGKLAVGHVVLNRMADRRFPQLACSVIK